MKCIYRPLPNNISEVVINLKGQIYKIKMLKSPTLKQKTPS